MFKKLVVAITLMTGVMLTPSSVMAGTPHRKLGVSTSAQSKSNYCWAASAQAVIRYVRGSAKSQCDLVKQIDGGKCDNRGGSPADVYDVLLTNRVRSSYYQGALSRDYMRKQINNGSPILISFKWKSVNNGHLIVIDGYDGNDFYVDYITEAKAYQIKMSYSDLINTNSTKTYRASTGTYVRIAPHYLRHTFYAFGRI